MAPVRPAGFAHRWACLGEWDSCNFAVCVRCQAHLAHHVRQIALGNACGQICTKDASNGSCAAACSESLQQK